MKLDTNTAWSEAVALVSANRQVLWAIAGVFFVLPNFAFSVLYPQPQPALNATPAILVDELRAYWATAWPWFFGTTVLQVVGTLTILHLVSDRKRPTVSEAIRRGTSATVPVLLAQLITGLAMLLIALLIIALGVASGNIALAVLAALVALGPISYITVRTLLVSPVVVTEQIRNPIAALRRAWSLTEGHAGQLLLFLFLLILAVGVVFGLLMLVLNMVLSQIFSAEAARFLEAGVSSLIAGGVSIYGATIVAAIHRQLAGPSAERVAEPFS